MEWGLDGPHSRSVCRSYRPAGSLVAKLTELSRFTLSVDGTIIIIIIIIMGVKIQYACVNWIHLAQDRAQWDCLEKRQRTRYRLDSIRGV